MAVDKREVIWKEGGKKKKRGMTREKVHNKKQIKTDKEIYEELNEKEKKVY